MLKSGAYPRSACSCQLLPGDLLIPVQRRSLQNMYLTCRSGDKLIQFRRLIKHECEHQQNSRFIVYFATCACVDYFFRVSPATLLAPAVGSVESPCDAQILPAILPPSVTLHSLHGHLPPANRTKTLAAFASSVATPASPQMLLATDVAARGLDLPDVDVVIQFDPPSDPKTFSHRCGRTARAGRNGRAWVFLVAREVDYVGELVCHCCQGACETDCVGRRQTFSPSGRFR